MKILSFISILVFFAGATAWADGSDIQSEGGVLFIPPTFGGDHLKVGPRLGATLYERSPWSGWIVMDLGLVSPSAVNPGATATTSAPDLQETHQGSKPLLLRTLVLTPISVLHFRLCAGLTWYYPDLSYSAGAGIPNAPTLALYGKFQATSAVGVELYGGLSLNPFGTVGILILPEAALLVKLSSNFRLRPGFRLPLFHSTLYGGAAGAQASFSLGLVAGG